MCFRRPKTGQVNRVARQSGSGGRTPVLPRPGRFRDRTGMARGPGATRGRDASRRKPGQRPSAAEDRHRRNPQGDAPGSCRRLCRRVPVPLQRPPRPTGTVHEPAGRSGQCQTKNSWTSRGHVRLAADRQSQSPHPRGRAVAQSANVAVGRLVAMRARPFPGACAPAEDLATPPSKITRTTGLDCVDTPNGVGRGFIWTVRW